MKSHSSKLLTFMQAKSKQCKFPSFNLAKGVKLCKNFAQKLLAVSLCAVLMLLCVPITSCVAEATIVVSGTCEKPTFFLNQAPLKRSALYLSKLNNRHTRLTLAESAQPKRLHVGVLF